MAQWNHAWRGLALAGAISVTQAGAAAAQATMAPVNDAPNPYSTVENYFKLPEGRPWGSTSAVDVDPDGKSIWVAERCGQNGCWDRATGQMSPVPVILKFDANGTLVKSFGIDPLWFAVVFLVMLQTSYLTPPMAPSRSMSV